MIRIKVDGKFLYKGELSEWIRRPPDQFKDAIVPGARPEPHMKAILVLMADAVVMGGDLKIEVTTTHDGFDLKFRRS